MIFAICISGELRTGLQAWNKNLKYFRDSPHEYVFFFQTWSENSNPRQEDSISELFRNVFLRRIRRYKPAPPVNSEEILNLFKDFNKVFLTIRPNGEWEDESSRIPKLPQGRLGNKILGSMRMFFLIEQCDIQRIKYEKSEGLIFDGVLRIRPDSILQSNPFDQLNDSGYDLLFYHDPNQDKFLWGPVNDQIFIGRSEVMSKATKVYSGINRVGKELDWHMPKDGIHEVLVAESALSWHVKDLRSVFRIGSSELKTNLLRPQISTDKISEETLKYRQRNFFNLTKHFIKKALFRPKVH